MAVKNAARSLPATYFALIRKFPLTHICDDEQLEAALAMIDRLLERDLDKGGEAYLDALTDLVEVYEEKNVPIQDATEAEVLRELMRSNGLTQEKLAAKSGIAQSTLSAVLSGARSLTKEQVIVLARIFNVSASAFMQAM